MYHELHQSAPLTVWNLFCNKAKKPNRNSQIAYRIRINQAVYFSMTACWMQKYLIKSKFYINNYANLYVKYLEILFTYFRYIMYKVLYYFIILITLIVIFSIEDIRVSKANDNVRENQKSTLILKQKEISVLCKSYEFSEDCACVDRFVSNSDEYFLDFLILFLKSDRRQSLDYLKRLQALATSGNDEEAKKANNDLTYILDNSNYISQICKFRPNIIIYILYGRMFSPDSKI